MAETRLIYDPYGAQAHADPYPIYRRLRDEAPLYHNPDRGFWAVSRYDDVAMVSRDWERFTVTKGVDIDNAGDLLGPGFFLAQDPPVHGKMRAVVKQAFGLRTIRDLTEAGIRREAEALVADIAVRPEADLAVDLAWLLPSRAMGVLLGFPREDADRLRDLGIAFMRREVDQTVPPASSEEAGMALMEYFEVIIDERRRAPRDDLLSAIATATIDGVPLAGEAPGMALLIYVGGFENVGCMLTNALYWLALHPDQRTWLAANPDGLPAAIEEVLRFDGPQQSFKRTTTQAVELHGRRVPAGAPVYVLYGAANRDERKFPDADRFDVHRTGGRQLSFGDGIHHCLGAPMARLEGQIVLETVLRRMPHYELTGEPELAPSHAVRGFLTMPVAPACSPAAA
ncbi:cytochrome P450 [Capillimicrobium parvum]|uniref:Cytochrome P450 123 n=1 Tax=Capillimicrobium parvum TaxID=2884022 RepID=A0A9E6XVK5_9ACTN|nr:cytochrome P450 [Capillimicrobium parvum]UGS35282.1 Putative cytochrome P450 123 [Capillimicrobium parvum]